MKRFIIFSIFLCCFFCQPINATTSEEINNLLIEQELYKDALLTSFTLTIDAYGLHIENEKVKTLLDELNIINQKIKEYDDLYKQLKYREAQEKIKKEQQLKKEEMERKHLLAIKEEEKKKHTQTEEYEFASIIFNFLIVNNFSKEVAAGILGNIMTEVGGQTLNIQYWLNTKTYYGMCQWNKEFYPAVINAELDEQCEFLLNTIKYEFGAFGRLANTTYEDFLLVTDVREAALIFATVYERCSQRTYTIRQDCAEIAYEYFNGKS